MRLLPFLVAVPIGTAFIPYKKGPSIYSRSTTHSTTQTGTVVFVTSVSSTQQQHVVNEQIIGNNNNAVMMERVGQTARAAFLAFAISFSSIHTPVEFSDYLHWSSVPSANAMSSITLAKKPVSEDEQVIESLEKETREAEREAQIDKKKARIEESRERFFEYDAKMAKQTEDRIEAAELKAEKEFEADKEEVEKLKELESKAEKEVGLAKTKQDKAKKLKEAKVCLYYSFIHLYLFILLKPSQLSNSGARG